MAEYQLEPINALGLSETVDAEIGLVRIVENNANSLASIAIRLGNEKKFSFSARKLLGFALPGPGESASSKTYSAFWSAPNQWFVEASEKSHADIAHILKEELAEMASVTEQTGGWCRFDIEGKTVTSMLERLCMLDMAGMKAGAANRSVIEHIGVFLLCRREHEAISVYGPRSMADSLHHALIAAAKSIA